jgi:hypothetical protein
LLEELASYGILLRVAAQAGPYTLSRDMVSVGWWKRSWELYQHLLVNLVVQAIFSEDAVVSVVFGEVPEDAVVSVVRSLSPPSSRPRIRLIFC